MTTLITLYFLFAVILTVYGANCHVMVFLFRTRWKTRKALDKKTLGDFYGKLPPWPPVGRWGLWFGALYVAAFIVLVIGLGLTFLSVHDRMRSIFLAFGCLLLCLPTPHPWYLALIAPFAAF